MVVIKRKKDMIEGSQLQGGCLPFTPATYTGIQRHYFVFVLNTTEGNSVC